MTKIFKLGGVPPQKTEQDGTWVVYFVSGKWRRIRAKMFKTERGAYRFYNSLPLDN